MLCNAPQPFARSMVQYNALPPWGNEMQRRVTIVQRNALSPRCLAKCTVTICAAKCTVAKVQRNAL